MKIHGIGTISRVGRGVKRFIDALESDSIKPEIEVYSEISNKSIPVYRVSDDDLKDKEVLNKARSSATFLKWI